MRTPREQIQYATEVEKATREDKIEHRVLVMNKTKIHQRVRQKNQSHHSKQKNQPSESLDNT